MAKNSALFNLYKERITRCKSGDELVQLSKEISKISFRMRERTALIVACVFAAKWFDKHGVAPTKEQLDSGDLDVTQDAAAAPASDPEDVLQEFDPYPEVL